MDSVRIQIKDTAYPVVFGYGVSAKLGRHWGLTGIIPLFQKAMGIMGINEEEAVSSSAVENKAKATKETPLQGGAGGGLDELKLAESLLQFDNLELLADILSFGIAQGLKVNVDELPFDRETLLGSMLEDVTATTQAYMAFIMTMPRPKTNGQQPTANAQQQKKRKPRPSAKKG